MAKHFIKHCESHVGKRKIWKIMTGDGKPVRQSPTNEKSSLGVARQRAENSRKTSASASLTMLKTLTVDHNKLWKILQEIGTPDRLTCLLRNLYAGQEATVRTRHVTTEWFQIGKGVCQGCILSPCLFNLYAEYIMQSAGLDETQAGIKIAGEM